jgi:hypothetical protein
MTNPKDIHITTRLPLQAKRAQTHNWFKKGNPGGPGRPKGSPNKLTREIKLALLNAVEHVGEEIAEAAAEELKKQGRAPDPDMPRGIGAYLAHVARNHPQVMCAMLARLMPQQTEATPLTSRLNKSATASANSV